MQHFNLSEWALKHRQLMYFFMALCFVAGILSYLRLGRAEDPSYTVREMVVSVAWPGATAKQMEEQVVDKIEKKLQETPGLDSIRSKSQPGVATIYVKVDDYVAINQIKPTWLKVRNMVGDIRSTLPADIQGPFFNDTFGDTFGSIYVLTSDDFSMAELKDEADRLRLQLLTVPDVSKVDIIGAQQEKIYIEIENSKLAALQLDPALIVQTLSRQNAMTPAGRMETDSDNVYLRVSGMFQSVEQIQSLGIRANGRTFRLGDIARVHRGYSEPPDAKMYFNGKPAVGLAVSMRDGGNILSLGENLNKELLRIRAEMPAGMEISSVADQPQVVKESISEFMKTLLEAVVIVLVVSFFSLGRRAGLVVVFSIPLVLCCVFIAMKGTGIDLHKTSLGALIIALGLLVDDAIIAIEMMQLKLEQGFDKERAASYAYTVTAVPMLTGTLITAAGFMPVGFSAGSTSEYTGAIFWVVAMALVVSWIVAVTVIPLLGHRILKVTPHAGAAEAGEHEVPDTRFNRAFRRILEFCLRRRWLVIGTTLAAFVACIAMNSLVKEEFFPQSVRPELIVELTLPEGASLAQTDETLQKFQALLDGDERIVNIAGYLKKPTPRFVLVVDAPPGGDNFAQAIILTTGAEARISLEQHIREVVAPQLPQALVHSRVLSTGPPASYPVMLRVSGEKVGKVREIAAQVAAELRGYPGVTTVAYDWFEQGKSVQIAVDQDKARVLGADSQALAASLQTALSGYSITDYRERDKTIPLMLRNEGIDKNDLAALKALQIHIGQGRYVPLEQIARISYGAEDASIWRRTLRPTITVQAEVAKGVTGNDVTSGVYERLASLRQQLPPGYSIAIGGNAEDSAKSMEQLVEIYPAMIVVILILLMLQLQNISKMLLVLFTAPLGLIGVTLFLVVLQKPMGYVAQLGVIALAGMIMRNSVILIDQIDQHLAKGEAPWHAIINSALLRFRPIMLTAAAAILAMIPLSGSAFWGPMAVAIMGGLFVATVLTLLFLPALYAAWYKVESKENE